MRLDCGFVDFSYNIDLMLSKNNYINTKVIYLSYMSDSSMKIVIVCSFK